MDGVNAASLKPPGSLELLFMRLPSKVAWILLGSLIIGCLGVGFYQFRQQRFLYLSRRHVSRGELSEAMFYAKLVWQSNPRNDQALSLLAEITARYDTTQALYWNGLRAENDPNNPDCQLDFTSSLLKAGQMEAGAKILCMAAGMPKVNPLRLSELQAAYALAEHQPDRAEKLYRHLVTQQPDQPSFTYSLANLLLVSLQSSKRAEGLQLLEKLWNEKKMPLEASRSLVKWALFEKETSRINPWVEFLQQSQESNLQDQYLAGLALLAERKFLTPEWLKRLTDKCLQPGDVYGTLQWFRQQHQQQMALTWFESLPLSLREIPLNLIARAEVMADLGQWPELHQKLKDEEWRRADHFRLAFLRQAHLQATNDARSLISQVYWKQMLSSLSKTPGDYYRLSGLLEHWSWSDAEQENLLYELTTMMEPDKNQIFSLIQESEKRRNTLALFYFGRLALKLEPTSLIARNNVANYGLLLGKELTQSRQLAYQLLQEQPNNSAVRVTQAFSLYQQGLFEEALAIIEELSETARSQPKAALYYGLVLGSLDKKVEAQKYLKLAQQSTHFLPEEQKLLEEALSSHQSEF
jgi:hypothetical protein